MKNYKITVNGQSYDVTVEELGGAGAPAGAQQRSSALPTAAAKSAAEAPAAQAAAAPGQSKAGAAQIKAGAVQIKAPMPGTLLAFKVAKGQAVKRGDVLLILEAMKMENEIVAPSNGTVAALHVAEGASVSTGDLLIELS